MFTQSLDGNWWVRKSTDDQWIPATVPGSIHTDLLSAGMIPDPAVEDNELNASWIALEDWVYQRAFTVGGNLLEHGRVFLECDGLDTLATLRLNGVEIGRTDNMHRRYSFDVTSRVRSGENTLEVEFRSPVVYALEQIDSGLVITPSDSIPGSPFLRKSMYQWGWDWSPKMPTSGIWRSIRLTGRSDGKLNDIHVRQHHGEDGVTVEVDVTVERLSAQELVAKVTLTSPDGRKTLRSETIGYDTGAAGVSFLVEDPALWWPSELGPHPLYELDVQLKSSEAVVDFRSMRMGLRTIELRQEKDEWGRSFVFVVNGVPVFCKGANWIPADQFPARVTREKYLELIDSAARAHMNMIRVWGGGIYEDEYFYDLCDERGILIWQDFMFAGAHYPASPSFLENVSAEIRENIRRIRHRPCLALWCGNNEMEWFLARGWAGEGDEERKKQYADLFHGIIPEIHAQEDPDTPYWPSSPASTTPFLDPNGEEEGDGHYWDVWHGRAPFTAYRRRYFRFMSEFGFQSFPSLNTVRAFAEPKDWNTSSYVMEFHQKSYVGNGQIISDLLRDFRLPSGFSMLVYLSQVVQAEAVRYGVEHWRRNRNDNRCMGALYWQLNDCWPVASWSSIEYNLQWKALHYSAKRFFAPVLLSAEETSSGARLYVTNDKREPFRGEVRWSLEGLDGKIIEDGIFPVEVGPTRSENVADLDFSGTLTDPLRRQAVLVLGLWENKRRLSLSLVPFVPTKYLELPHADIAAEVEEDGDDMRVTLVSHTTARFVMLETPGHDVRFSDNFFDLPAGRVVTVKVERPAGLSAEELDALLKVISLRDSY